MPGLWRNQEGTREGKYLVLRRDGTKPEWPFFVIGAADPAAPMALRAYASMADFVGMDKEYIRDILALADEFDDYRCSNGEGDPAAPRHRKDDPSIVEKMNE